MEIEKEAFSELIEYYKLLPLRNKRMEIINQIEQIISNYSKMCAKLGIIPNILLNKEMLNINREELYAYLNAVGDISGQFINIMSDMLENKN